MCFNSRTREGATFILLLNSGVFGFNSRTREGATVEFAPSPSRDMVSIHAPVKVRPPRNKDKLTVQVSIHAPVKVRPAPVGLEDWYILFQFTHP